jgi:hypothetical protein
MAAGLGRYAGFMVDRNYLEMKLKSLCFSILPT